jgi:hypothetical protein
MPLSTMRNKGSLILSWQQSERPLIPLYRGMPPLSLTESSSRVDLIIAPDLYLLKTEPLPVRFAHQAKKIAPSLMEDLGAGPDWAYEALKSPEGWQIFAYDPRQLLETAQKAGLSLEQIGKLYFAQQFSDQLTAPLPLNEDLALATLGGTVTLLPLSQEDHPKQSIRVERLSSPKKGFTLQGAGRHALLGPVEAGLLASALLLLAVAWIVEGWQYHRAAQELRKPLEQSLKVHPTLASGITRRNILQRYRDLDRPQRKIRETLRSIGSLTSKDSRLSSLKITPTGYEAGIEAPAQKLPALIKLAKQEGLSASVSGNTLLLKGAWK